MVESSSTHQRHSVVGAKRKCRFGRTRKCSAAGRMNMGGHVAVLEMGKNPYQFFSSSEQKMHITWFEC